VLVGALVWVGVLLGTPVAVPVTVAVLVGSAVRVAVGVPVGKAVFVGVLVEATGVLVLQLDRLEVPAPRMTQLPARPNESMVPLISSLARLL